MKQILSFTLAIAVLALLTTLDGNTAFAQTGSIGKGAMQQWGPFDDDGDGIPNGLDPDYVKPKDGTGHQFGKLNGGSGWMNGRGYGPGYGLGNQGIGPRDGSGYGPGTGTCDGTGPKGKGRGGR